MSVVYSIGMTIEQLKRDATMECFKFFDGNKTRTAASLGISIRTLETWLEEYDNANRDRKQNEYNERAQREGARIKEREQLLRMQPNSDAARDIAQAKETQKQIFTNAGLRVEPAANPPAQHEMPVHERKEVQSVLPAKAAQGGPGKRR